MSNSPQNPAAFAHAQMAEMDRMLALAGDHPVMGPAIRNRRAAFEAQLKELPVYITSPRAILYFSGAPVFGSLGIDAGFVAKVLDPFLEMVKTQYAATKHGRVGARGPRKDETEARLLLTDLPRGSFGLELSQPLPHDLFSGQQLKQVLTDLTELIGSAGENEQSFAKSLGQISPRVLPRLTDFLKTVADAKAELRVVSDQVERYLSQPQLEQAKELVLTLKSEEEEIREPGFFRGATLDSWRFDFRTDGGESLNGRLSQDMNEDQAASLLPQANQHCVARLSKTTVTTRGGTPSIRYELLELLPIAPPSTQESSAAVRDEEEV